MAKALKIGAQGKVKADDSRRHCILHIGTEKTATTLLQDWLYSNAKQLSEQHVGLTRSALGPSGHNNRKMSSYFQEHIDDFMRANQVRTQEEKALFFKDFESTLGDEILELQSTGHHTVIFSSEHFHSRLKTLEQIQGLKSFLDRYFSSFTVLCYFREQSRVRTSLYSTGLKIDFPKKIDEFDNFSGTDRHYYNYWEFFQKWEKVFGLASLRPRLFAAQKLVNSDIRHDFLTTVLPEADHQKLSFEVGSANRSLSNQQARIFQAINAVRPVYTGRFADPTGGIVKKAVMACAILDEEEAISDPRQQEFFDRFDKSNKLFCERYFGKKENLFTRPPQILQDVTQQKAFTVEDIATIITAIFSNPNIVALHAPEIDGLRDLALKLRESRAASADEILKLLAIAGRARPHGNVIKAEIDSLLEEKHSETANS